MPVSKLTFRLPKILVPVLVVAMLAIGSVAHAQETISGDEDRDRETPENVIVVEVDSLQAEELKKFLQEHRLVIRQSRSDHSAVLKEFREDFKKIKQEYARTLKTARQYKPPVIVLKRTVPIKKKISRLPESPPALEIFFPEQKIFEPQKRRSEEKLLNLKERQLRADIEQVRREKDLRAQNTDLGRLKVAIKKEPLKSYQDELTQFSEKIKNLLRQLQGEGVQRTVFLDLGNTYLESQKYLNSLRAKDRLKLTSYASHSGTILGSYESALWVLKMALVRNPNDGDTNFLIGKILSGMGERDLALRRVRNAEYLFVKNSQPDKAAKTLNFIESLKNTSAKN